jgi:ankyrin repeat protein
MMRHMYLTNSLIDAAREGDLDLLQKQVGPHNVNAIVSRWSTSTLLIICVEYGHVNCARYLLSIGANIKQRDSNRCTALHLACRHIECMRMLLEAGAELEVTNRKGYTPLRLALERNDERVIKALVTAGAQVGNVKLNVNVPSVPDWVVVLHHWRAHCQYSAILVLGIHRYRRPRISRANDKNILLKIGQLIWNERRSSPGSKKR